MNVCNLAGCIKTVTRGRFCCKEHYWEWLRRGNAPKYWQGKKRPNVGKKISRKLKGRPNLALKGRKFPGRKNSGQFKPGQEPWNAGIKMPEKYKATPPVMYGADNPSWKGGISFKNARLRKSERYIKWRNWVFERDDYTCRTCGQVGGQLVAHHVKRWADYPRYRFALINGLTMCRSCHSRLHNGSFPDDDEPIIEILTRALDRR